MAPRLSSRAATGPSSVACESSTTSSLPRTSASASAPPTALAPAPAPARADASESESDTTSFRLGVVRTLSRGGAPGSSSSSSSAANAESSDKASGCSRVALFVRCGPRGPADALVRASAAPRFAGRRAPPTPAPRPDPAVDTDRLRLRLLLKLRLCLRRRRLLRVPPLRRSRPRACCLPRVPVPRLSRRGTARFLFTKSDASLPYASLGVPLRLLLLRLPVLWLLPDTLPLPLPLRLSARLRLLL